MKLEHLIQAYKVNGIETELNEILDKNDNAGTIIYGEGIISSYLLDDKDIVVALKLFANCLARDSKKLNAQLNHIFKILNVIQNTIMLIANIPQKECNMILEKLGLFDNTFRNGKQIKHLEHSYRIEVIDGLLCFTINEIEINKNN